MCVWLQPRSLLKVQFSVQTYREFRSFQERYRRTYSALRYYTLFFKWMYIFVNFSVFWNTSSSISLSVQWYQPPLLITFKLNHKTVKISNVFKLKNYIYIRKHVNLNYSTHIHSICFNFIVKFIVLQWIYSDIQSKKPKSLTMNQIAPFLFARFIIILCQNLYRFLLLC